MKVTRTAGLALGLLFAGLARAQSVDIRVENNYWNAFQPPVKSELKIQGKDGKYTADGKSVDSGAMLAFIKSLDEPAIKEISLENLGLTQEWINANAQAAFKEYFKDRASDVSPVQKDLFERSFRDLRFMRNVVQAYYGSFWTDDYPKIYLTMHVNSRTIQLSSTNQHQFMIPWTIIENGEARESFNANISHALAAILPERAVHKSRLDGKNLRYALSEHLYWTLRDEWAILTTEAKMPEDIQKIRKKYNVEKSDVGCIASIDVEGACPSWNATLRSPDLPANYAIGVSLPYEKGHVLNLTLFEEKISVYSQVALSVPWFRRYLEGHPDAEAQIRFVLDRSLSARAAHELLDDLRKHGKNELAKLVETNAPKAVFVEVSDEKHNWSRWVIFPDGDMLLWHFRSDTVLDFPATKFVTWEYYGWKSAGALIKPDGTYVQ